MKTFLMNVQLRRFRTVVLWACLCACAAALGVIFPVPVFAATLSKPANNLGLVGHWSFNEGTSTTATDFSGRGNHGTLQTFSNPASATSGWTTAGKLSAALNFDGASDYVSATFPTISTSAATVSMWVNSATDIPSGTVGLFDFGDFGIELFSTGDVRFELWGTSNETGGFTVSKPSVGQWTHYVFVYDGTNKIMYINGVQAGSAGATGSVNIGGTTMVGKMNGTAGADHYWEGGIDEVRFYNRALTASEVASLYRSGSVRYGNSTSLAQGALSEGLVGHWTFDGNDMTTNAADVSSSNYDGYLRNFTGTTTAVGTIGQAIDFPNDATTRYIDVGNVLHLANEGSFTVSVWLRPAASIARNEIFAKSNSSNNAGMEYTFQISSNKPCLVISDGTNTQGRCGATNLTIQGWQHILVQYDSVAKFIYVYRNGVLDGSGSYPLGTPNTNSQGLRIGSLNGSHYHYKGQMDDLRVYNRLLSLAEIKQLYNLAADKANASSRTLTQGSTLASGLVGYWTFDGVDFTDKVYDRSGQNDHGYLYSVATSAAKTIGKMGQGIKFDASGSQYARLDAGAQIVDVQNMSMALWLKTTNSTADPWFISLRSSTTSNPTVGFRAFYAGGNNVFFLFRHNGSTGSLEGSNDTGSVYRDGNWHHYVGTRLGDVTTLYRDGVQVDQDTLSGTGIGSFSLDKTTLGATGSTGAYSGFISASLDDVRIYNRALTSAEVKRLYNLGR